MPEESSFYRNILENMTDGVMTLDLEGRIIMFNPAAARILGLSEKEVLDQTFGEVFLLGMDGIDDFNQAILDAVHKSKVGYTKVVDFKRKDDTIINLAVTSSYLQHFDDVNADNAGVIIVFSDITDIQKLQQAEKELNQKLRDAYLEIEASNQNLQALLKKVQVVRIAATILVILIFSSIGLYMWNRDIAGSTGTSQTDRQIVTSSDNLPTYVVGPRPISSGISLSGFVEPLYDINVLAPFDGKVASRHFEYNQQVAKGDLLLQMDTSQIEVKLREARVMYIKAQQQYEDLKNWSESNDVSRAKRAFIKAKNSLELTERKLRESALLFEKGIISAGEHESVNSQYENEKIDFAAVEEELATVLEKGSPDNIKIAEFELKNAKIALDELEMQFKNAVVLAPVDGVVIQPMPSGNRKKETIESGASVNMGDVLLTVGNFDGISINSQVDEIDISKVKKDQTVIISGDAFEGLNLKGKISYISDNAIQKGSSQAPMFNLTVSIPVLKPEEKNRIRLGMSAHLDIQAYHNPDALMVPIGMVYMKNGKKWVNAKNRKTGEASPIAVETGITTLDMVEITGGLQPGDEIVLERINM